VGATLPSTSHLVWSAGKRRGDCKGESGRAVTRGKEGESVVAKRNHSKLRYAPGNLCNSEGKGKIRKDKGGYKADGKYGGEVESKPRNWGEKKKNHRGVVHQPLFAVIKKEN